MTEDTHKGALKTHKQESENELSLSPTSSHSGLISAAPSVVASLREWLKMNDDLLTVASDDVYDVVYDCLDFQVRPTNALRFFNKFGILMDGGCSFV